jgi:hypothetical protein
MLEQNMKARFLRRNERAYAQAIFGRTIPFDDILITDDTGYQIGQLKPFETPTGANKYCLPLGREGFQSCLAVSVREQFLAGLTCVWQRRHLTVHEQRIQERGAKMPATRDSSGYYEVGRPWRAYSLEQQARMIIDWVSGGMLPDDPRATYITRHIRAGVA